MGALAQMADGFECDIRLTKDRQLALWHDADMKRIANNPSKVAKLTLAQMQSIAPVLTVDQLFHIAINSKKDLFLETKHPVPTRGAVERELLAYLDAYKNLISKAGIEIKLMSFSKLAVRRFVRNSSYTPMQLIKSFPALKRAHTQDLGIGVFLLRERPEIIDELKKKGHRLHIWTVDSPAEALWLSELGVDSIVTNRPGLIRDHLK